MNPEFWLGVIIAICSAIGSGLAVFVAIKVDLAVTRYTANEAKKAADAAHLRIDTHLGVQKT